LFIEQVLRSLPSVEVFQGDPARGLPTTQFDLYIFDGWLPPTLPDADMLIIDPPGSSELFNVLGESENTDNPRVKRDDSRMAFVDFDSVNIASFKVVEADWAEALITSDGGPLLLAGETDAGHQVAILTFNLFDSDLPLQITWPVLVAALLDWYHPQDIVFVPDGLNVGDSIMVRPPLTASSVRVTLPDGETRNLPAGRDAVVFAETHRPGIYTLDVFEGGTIEQSTSFAVNLFDPGESNIAPRTEITLGEVTVSEAQEQEVGQREFWPWLALAALLFLLLEWYAYHRRLRPPKLSDFNAKRQARKA
jgi:Ca-activated chloride channel homolog